MLHYFKFKNFFSIAEETEVSFRVGPKTPKTDLICSGAEGARLSKLMAIIGANGSGKTNVLKPLAFLRWFICDSFSSKKPDDDIPVEPHFFLNENNSEFEMVFEIEGQLYRYNLIVNRRKVVHEALFLKTSKFFSYLFRRDWDETKDKYLIRQQKFGFAVKEAEKVRPNASLISTAAQYNVSCALSLVKFFSRFHSNVDYGGRDHFEVEDLLKATEFFHEWPDIKQRMANIMCHLDLGLSDVAIEKHEITDKTGDTRELPIPYGIHRKADKEVRLPLWQESNGTQRAYVLLLKMLPALADGGVVIIDEMEANMHPEMLTTLLEMFMDPDINPHNAQIIFTCHVHEVLNILDKTQILLVEKDKDGMSDVWRLDEIQGVRRDDNLYAKYRAGAYGAVPNF